MVAACSVPIELIPAGAAELRASFNSGKTKSLAWRIGQLHAMEKMLKEGKKALCDALYLDLRKNSFEAWLSEIGTLEKELYDIIEDLEGWMQPKRVGTDMANQGGSSSIEHEPLGVALILGAWNFNVNLTLMPLIGAICAGNCAFVKPGSYSPAVATVMSELAHKYLDTSCIKFCEGNRLVTGALLDLRWDIVFFTGSTLVGKLVAEKSAQNLTPCILELGGKSPCIVDKGTDVLVAARRIAYAGLMNSGQICVRPDFYMVHADVADEFVRTLKQVVKEFYGDNVQASDYFGRIVNDSSQKRLEGLLADSQQYLAWGGKTDASDKFVEPTLLDFGEDFDAYANSSIMNEEVFGPILPMVRWRNIDDVVNFINEREKPLGCYTFTEDDAVADAILSRTSSGGAIINDCLVHILNPELPFGGVGASGMGRYHGYASFTTFSNPKAVLRKVTANDFTQKYPPHTAANVKVMKSLTPAIAKKYLDYVGQPIDKSAIAKNVGIMALGAAGGFLLRSKL
jgi:aldehyde dehydrogenase (NAD+)